MENTTEPSAAQHSQECENTPAASEEASASNEASTAPIRNPYERASNLNPAPADDAVAGAGRVRNPYERTPAAGGGGATRATVGNEAGGAQVRNPYERTPGAGRGGAIRTTFAGRSRRGRKKGSKNKTGHKAGGDRRSLLFQGNTPAQPTLRAHFPVVQNSAETDEQAEEATGGGGEVGEAAGQGDQNNAAGNLLGDNVTGAVNPQRSENDGGDEEAAHRMERKREVRRRLLLLVNDPRFHESANDEDYEDSDGESDYNTDEDDSDLQPEENNQDRPIHRGVHAGGGGGGGRRAGDGDGDGARGVQQQRKKRRRPAHRSQGYMPAPGSPVHIRFDAILHDVRSGKVNLRDGQAWIPPVSNPISCGVTINPTADA